MANLEKASEEAMGAPGAQVLAMAGVEEQELLIPDLRRVQPIEGGAVAAGIVNPNWKKWLPYWFLVTAASVIVLPDGRDDHAAPKDQFAMFSVFVCAVCLVYRTMKQMM